MNSLSFFEYCLMHLNSMPLLSTLCIMGKLECLSSMWTDGDISRADT